MSRARLRLAALLGAAAVVAPVLAVAPSGPASSTPTAGTSPTSTAPAPAGDPLEVTITGVSPAVVPQRGPVEITGTVSNDSIDTWRDVQLYGVTSPTPLTDAAALADAAESPDDLVVGERITEAGTFPDVGDLTPGASRSFTLTLPRRVLSEAGMVAEGVYWLGVQALGESDDGRDGIAEGRARTFIPLVDDSGTRTRVDTALVLPLRHQVRLDEEGRVEDLEDWATDLSPGGRLDRVLDFGAEAGGAPLTWLLDPAVPDTVSTVVAGNRGRSIAPSPGADDQDGGDGQDGDQQDGDQGDGDQGEGSPGPDEDADPTAAPDGGSTPDGEADPTQALVTQYGGDWLTQLRSVLGDGTVLALPYGDVDVDGALRGRSRMLQRARARSRAVTLELGLTDAGRAVTSPTGYLDPAALVKVSRADTVLLGDRAVPDVSGTRAQVAGRPVVLSDSGAAEGGPGPNDPLSPVAIRQRLLSEAALQLTAGTDSTDSTGGTDGPQVVEGDGDPQLVVTLPEEWSPAAGTDFFAEIADVDWMSLTSLADATEQTAPGPVPSVPATAVEYPDELRATQLGPSAFAEARGLVDAATVLQDVLPLNDTVARHALDEALVSLSFDSREDPDTAEQTASAATDRVRSQLDEVQVETPPSVTLSGESGTFSLQLTNGLPEPVEVRLRALTDDGLEISGPDSVEIPAGTGTTVRLTAATRRIGVSDVEVEVVDSRGRALGDSDRLPVRAVQIGNVIWLIMGVGAALLLGAVVLRLVRRVRAARRASAA